MSPLNYIATRTLGPVAMASIKSKLITERAQILGLISATTYLLLRDKNNSYLFARRQYDGQAISATSYRIATEDVEGDLR